MPKKRRVYTVRLRPIVEHHGREPTYGFTVPGWFVREHGLTPGKKYRIRFLEGLIIFAPAEEDDSRG